MSGRLPPRALNRALLARQGLLERVARPIQEVAEAIGAVQAQHWPAVPVAFWSRMRDLELESVYREFEAHRLLLGQLLRGTLHVVSARQYPAYAVVAQESGAALLRMGPDAPPESSALWAAVIDHAEAGPLGQEEIGTFIEGWIARHAPGLDGAWLARMRQYRWRPFRTTPALVRVPGDGAWGSRAPEAGRAVRMIPPAWPWPATSEALAAAVRGHLAAFGPAAAEDIAGWIGWRTPPVRAALQALAPELVELQDDRGRGLFDLQGAPRPDAETPAPARFLPRFDSTLLAYAARHRSRILPDAYRERVYMRANLQVLPTFLADGFVAGTWSVERRRQTAVLVLRPFAPLERKVRAALLEEGERLVRFSQPEARAHAVEVGE